MDLVICVANLKKTVKTIWGCHFSIIAFLVGAASLLFIPQGKDAILDLDGKRFWGHVFFIAAAFIWAFQIWYWARVMYYLKYKRVEIKRCVVKTTIALTPRILGGLALMSIAISALKMSHYSDSHSLTFIGVFFMILAVLFFLFVFFRRKLLGLKKLDDENQYNVDVIWRHTRIGIIPGLPKGTEIITTVLLIIAIVLFIVFTLIPERLTFVPSTAAVILLCISIWVPIGSFISYLSHRTRLPLFSILIVLALIFASWNDNHSVRLNETQPPIRIQLDQRIDHFLKKRVGKEIYIVSAEGGGIRAAYWTAGVLGAIQDVDPHFSDNLFAISSVSGGSLGAAIFVTLVKKKQEEMSTEYSFFNKAREILKEDFLSPVVASMFSGDMLQRFIPFSIPYLSRGNAIEKAWELAWEKHIETNEFNEPFTYLWDNDDACRIPLLFLNATWAEKGKRLIESPIGIDERFRDTHDIYCFLDKDIRVSTAVHNSSRFPYVCPAGTINNTTHVVDGGYFDNSGAITTLEIVTALKKKIDQEGINAKLVVIMIKNTPQDSNAEENRFLPGAVIPVFTILNIRTAHANYAELKLGDYIADELKQEFMVFEPKEGRIHFPLGWTLSEKVRGQLDDQIEEKVVPRWESRLQ